jgi:single-strand DNA-binding protein
LLNLPNLSDSDSLKKINNMAGVNKVILVGRLGKDPEVKYLEGGIAVAKITLATSEKRKNKEGERVEFTEWHNINFWRVNAENAEKYLKKGMQIYVEGKIRTRSWEKDGVKRYNTEIEGDFFQMLGKKEDGAGSSNEFKTSDSSLPTVEEGSPNDDLPF